MIFYSLPKKESLANGPQEPRSYPQALDIGKLQNVVISAGLDEFFGIFGIQVYIVFGHSLAYAYRL